MSGGSDWSINSKLPKAKFLGAATGAALPATKQEIKVHEELLQQLAQYRPAYQ
jgi:hypothetical protein